SALLQEVERRAVAAGHRTLVLSHIAGNEQAARFYVKHGFVTTLMEKGGSGMPDSIWMSKDLGDRADAT
ncbi:MAG: GNAT family N-acetyltransferase, partial [Terracoccus sp.]